MCNIAMPGGVVGVRYEAEGRIERTTEERARGLPLDLLALQFTVKEIHRQGPNREDNWEMPESDRLIPHNHHHSPS